MIQETGLNVRFFVKQEFDFVYTFVYTKNMNTKINKIGNSLGMFIPKNIAALANIEKGTDVSVEFSQGKIIVTPRKKRTLEEMVASISKNKMHKLEGIMTDDPVGKEIF